MRRGALLCTIVFLAGCASGGGPASAPASQTMRVVGPSSTEAIALSGGPETSTSRSLPYSVEKIWRALPAVLDSLGIPIETMDPAKRVIGNTGFKVHSRLKNVALSRYVDCGNSTGIGPNADNYEVHMVFLATVQPAQGNSSQVSLTFEAAAKPVNFAQDYSQCGSKAVLEGRVFDLLAARLAS
jgi:hypothetical protein